MGKDFEQEGTQGEIHHRDTEARSQPRKLSGQVCAWKSFRTGTMGKREMECWSHGVLRGQGMANWPQKNAENTKGMSLTAKGREIGEFLMVKQNQPDSTSTDRTN